jgi:hypothetical protein
LCLSDQHTIALSDDPLERCHCWNRWLAIEVFVVQRHVLKSNDLNLDRRQRFFGKNLQRAVLNDALRRLPEMPAILTVSFVVSRISNFSVYPP